MSGVPSHLSCASGACSRKREHGTPYGAALFVFALAIGLAGCAPEPLGGVVSIATSSSEGNLQLVAVTQPPGHRFVARGLDDRELAEFAALDPQRRAAVLQVHVVSGLDDPPPLLGTTSRDDDLLCFTPRFPLEPGVRYRMTLDRGKLPNAKNRSVDRAEADFSIPPKSSSPTTVVERIYPTSDLLPENQLKFYIHFSAPMSRGEAYRHVHLVDSSGKEVEAVFLELREELWDGKGQRFTLYFEPGRVKRGLKPREELGPVLYEGRSYTLVVDDLWRDATRVPLKAGARKTFSVGPPDDALIDPASWKLETPPAGSIEPLVVRFGEPLDHAQLEHVVSVATASGEIVAGSILTADHESRWQFTPQRPWSAGKYQLVAETTLEDLAGNSIGRPFEVDQFGPVQKRIETKTVSIPFTIAPAP